MSLPEQAELYELEALLDSPAKFRPLVVHRGLPARLMRMETKRAYFLGLHQASREIITWQCKCLIKLHFHPDASGIEEASAKVVCKAIPEIDDVVFHRHDFTVSGTAVGWTPKTAANHLHIEYGAEDRS